MAVLRSNRPRHLNRALMDQQCRAMGRIDRFYRFSAILFLVGLAAVSLCMISWALMSSPNAVANGLTNARPYLAVWRLFLFVGLIGGWPTFIHCLAIWSGIGVNQIRMLQDYRWHMALWLVVVEILLTQQVLAVFLKNLMR